MWLMGKVNMRERVQHCCVTIESLYLLTSPELFHQPPMPLLILVIFLPQTRKIGYKANGMVNVIIRLALHSNSSGISVYVLLQSPPGKMDKDD